MKNLEKILTLMAFVSATGSFCISLYTNTSWSWQLSTMIWVLVSYQKTRLIDTQEKIINKFKN